MHYLQGRKMTLTVEPNHNRNWGVGRSYTIHSEMKSHTVLYMTLWKGATYMTSSKAESVAIDTAMAWSVEQGVNVPTITIHQDNTMSKTDSIKPS